MLLTMTTSPSRMMRDPSSFCRISSWSVLTEASMLKREGVNTKKTESGLIPSPSLIRDDMVDGFFEVATVDRNILKDVAASYVINLARSIAWKRPAYRGPRC